RTPLQALVPAMLLPLCLPSPFLEPLGHLADSAPPFELVECLLDNGLLPLRFSLAGLPLSQALAASIAPRRRALVDLATPHPLSVKVAAYNLPPAALSGDKFPHRLLVDSTLYDSRRCGNVAVTLVHDDLLQQTVPLQRYSVRQETQPTGEISADHYYCSEAAIAVPLLETVNADPLQSAD
ncbi:MAG: hypothetical protein M1819_006371, partial [Sarea resinae]